MKTYNLLLIILSLYVTSCAPKPAVCNENLAFKEKFFNAIKDVDNMVNSKGEITRAQYEKSLGFLNHYVNVDYNKTLNYRNVYTFHGFDEDSKEWIKWYEENKCNNIQFKE